MGMVFLGPNSIVRVYGPSGIVLLVVVWPGRSGILVNFPSSKECRSVFLQGLSGYYGVRFAWTPPAF